MNALLERLRTALAPKYLVIDEIARGGMGVVFLGQEPRLNRKVAIKIIRPDAATAAATERFLREAQALASFNHPNIVTVLSAGESDGLAWYVMSYFEGETLEERLKKGPLSREEALQVSNDLLAALEVVHAHGLVHRDIKPANVFLEPGPPSRAMLGDFGISKDTTSKATGLTQDGYVPGTPAYMPPEHMAGDASARTDQCSAAMVIYELFTGRPWAFDKNAITADWTGVPPAVESATKRALAWAPEERWPSVADYRRALSGASRRIGRGPALINAAAMLGLLLVAWAAKRAFADTAGGPMRVQVQSLEVEGTGRAALGDSISAELRRSLGNATEITFTDAPGLLGFRRPSLNVSGTVAPRGDSLAVTLNGAWRGGEPPFSFTATASRSEVVNQLAFQLLLSILQHGPLPADMAGALPHTTHGLSMLARAEAKYGRAEWAAADSAFKAALAADPTCLLCLQRLSIITRWERLSVDTSLTNRLVASIDSFPSRYQMLIAAGRAPDRYVALDAARDRAPGFELAHFVYADEIFHRGPLAGFPRSDAIAALQRTVLLRPDFAPAWEHLAEVAIAQGDSATADSAIRAYGRTRAENDLTSGALHMVINTGFGWRFLSREVAVGTTEGVLGHPAIGMFSDLSMGSRYMLAFDAPEGALYVGRRFEHWAGRPDLLLPGLAGQIAAFFAMGQIDSARATQARMQGLSSDAELTLGAVGFDVLLALFDSLDARAALATIEPVLAPLTREGEAEPGQRRRAAFFLTLLARRAGETGAAQSWRRLVDGEPDSRPLATLLDADSAGVREPLRGMALSDPLLALDSAGRNGDPFARAALHLMRAQWSVDARNPRQALRALRWHENSDFIGGRMATAVQPVEPDRAFGTLARWRRARLLDGRPDGLREACTAYADVARLWANGDARYRARADSAGARIEQLRCVAG